MTANGKSELKTIIAFLFKRSGKRKLDSSNLYLTISMDLGWFPPNEAKELINIAIDKKILVKEENRVKPNFDVEATSLPTGFQPTKQLSEIKKETIKEDVKIVEKIIKKISSKTKGNKQDILKNVRRIEKEKKVAPEIAALLLGKERNVDITQYIKELEKEFFQIK